MSCKTSHGCGAFLPVPVSLGFSGLVGRIELPSPTWFQALSRDFAQGDWVYIISYGVLVLLVTYFYKNAIFQTQSATQHPCLGRRALLGCDCAPAIGAHAAERADSVFPGRHRGSHPHRGAVGCLSSRADGSPVCRCLPPALYYDGIVVEPLSCPVPAQGNESQGETVERKRGQRAFAQESH